MKITTLSDADPDFEVKELRLERIYRDAYLDRYKRLGYVEESRRVEVEDGKKIAVIVLKRDKSAAGYDQLNKIESEITELTAMEPQDKDVTDKRDKKRRLTLLIMLIAGAVVAAAGVAVLIYGFMQSNLILAISGWAVVIAGGVVIIVWSFLRESWRLRKKDISDAALNPGFGDDEIGRQIEEKLNAADKVRAGISAE